MPVLQPSEYDASYFDGKSQPLAHNAGYSKYERWYRRDPGKYPEDTGEFYSDIAASMHGRFNVNSDVLILGSAKGFIVADLRAAGVDAWGCDVSQYAYDQADTNVQPFLTVADAYTHLQTLSRNQFSVIFSRHFLCCIDDADIDVLIDEMNRVSRDQVHILFNHNVLNPLYYNVKTPEEWLAFDWENGTYLVTEPDYNTYLRK